MSTCPCDLSETYEACCGEFHKRLASPPTAEMLMRSRYCAFVKREIAYLKETTWPAYQKHFDEAGYRQRAEGSIWLGLTIHLKEDGDENDTHGTVTFTAKSMVNGAVNEQTEKSLFKTKKGKWYYVKAIE